MISFAAISAWRDARHAEGWLLRGNEEAWSLYVDLPSARNPAEWELVKDKFPQPGSQWYELTRNSCPPALSHDSTSWDIGYFIWPIFLRLKAAWENRRAYYGLEDEVPYAWTVIGFFTVCKGFDVTPDRILKADIALAKEEARLQEENSSV